MSVTFEIRAMTDITIRAAEASEIQTVSDFICTHFNDQEPIQIFHVRKGEEMDPPPADLLKECVESQTLMLALVGEKIVGVVIAGEITSEVSDQDLAYTKDFGPKGVDVFEFLSFISEKADLCTRMAVPRSLHIHILSVHLDYLRQGIAKKLFDSCMENGKVKHFPAISVDCTSFYTSKIAETFGLSCVSTVTYDEYNKHVGKILFKPVDPHKEINTYAMLYDNNCNNQTDN